MPETEQNLQPRRSLIFAPGTKPDMFPKAMRTGADIVTIDLEDAIVPEQKPEAREKTLAWFAEGGGEPAAAGVERVVRINALRSPEGLADVLAILEAPVPPPALMLPKVKTPDEVALLDELLTGSCAGVRFHVIIETNPGLQAAHEIARASPRIDALLLGAVDMAAELRTEVAWEELLYVRSRLVHAAAGAGIDLIDVPFLDLNDEEGLQREAAACARLGFTGKGAIHPRQIPVLNAAFSPTPEAVEQARRVIRAFEEGDSGLVLVDGKLIEKPVLRTMYRRVAIADRMAEREAAAGE